MDPENLWGMAEYGLSGIWVMTESTVYVESATLAC